MLSNEGSEYPLSPIQQGMLFHTLYEQSRGVNIEQIVCSIREEANDELLAAAWRETLARHDVFRSSFHWAGTKTPVQRILSEVVFPCAIEDWSEKTEEEQQSGFREFLRQDRKRGFALTEAPLTRLAILKLSAYHYKLVWTVHHGIVDGFSFPLVLGDAFELYEAKLAGSASSGSTQIPAQRRTFRSHVEWLQAQDHSAQSREYWQSRLKGFTTRTALPLDGSFPVSEDEAIEHGQVEVVIPAAVSETLRALAKSAGVTMSTIVQAGWAVLLSRHSGEQDVVFGATRACRQSAGEGADSIIGILINTLPVRTTISPDARIVPWLRECRADQIASRAHEHTSLMQIQEWSDLQPAGSLFDSILVFNRGTLDSDMRALSGKWLNREARLYEKTNYPLALYGYDEPALLLKLAYDKARYDRSSAQRLLAQLSAVLHGIAANPEGKVADLPVLTADERRRMEAWNNTGAPGLGDLCIHELIEAQVQKTPDHVAAVFEGRQLTYRELNERSNQLAHYLIKCGVGPETLVGICLERSLEMLVGLLGILKAGGAYIPLDPGYPAERIALMLEDSKVPVVLTGRKNRDKVAGVPKVVCVDDDAALFALYSTANPATGVTPGNLCYIIYTSGSTGRPKGVMLMHGNVMNFFAGMDAELGTTPGVWLAVTSISFDISVLELFWTLARGFKVVLLGDDMRLSSSSAAKTSSRVEPLDFSLFYFASNEAESAQDKYRLLLEGARFADKNGFSAVWTPERHFHAFGGLYPNPSVASAAIAAITANVRIRAGSVVLPLHNPLRVAEEWSVVDNLSGGRVGISFASGWHQRDFVLAPANYSDAKNVMLRNIDTVRRLWRGEAVTMPDGKNTDAEIRILPRPVQPELPFWITAAGNPETFRVAGEMGASLLTHLLGQKFEQVAEKIRVYREAWRSAGHPGNGHVTLMLHTFVGPDAAEVRETVREPFTNYLKSSMDLIKNAPWAFPVFKNRPVESGKGINLDELSAEEMEALLGHAFQRYFETSGLFGTPDECVEIAARVRDLGVDEIACLIDFGVSADTVLEHLQYLNEVRLRSNRPRVVAVADYSLPSLVRQHGVTHLQCTPSMARMLTLSPETRTALGSIKTLLVGGEALPPSLAKELRALSAATIHNMYGPTETAIWSTTCQIRGDEQSISIGRPIANTDIHILDSLGRTVPVRVAGELHIGGLGVARGYYNRPDLTDERFIPHPYKPGERLYKTGDLARFLEDGSIDFLGRCDFQVKIRGHRIELGDIETALSTHPAVRQAVVMARDADGDTILAAYIEPRNAGAPIDPAELRRHLEEKLPAPMLPSAYVVMDAFPLTPNGKIDRKALPAPDRSVRPAAGNYAPPDNALERTISEVWQQMLGIPQVGRDDNFFDLGAHSILMVQVHSRLKEALGMEVSLLDLFRFPTVRQIAAELAKNSGGGDQSGAETAASVAAAPGGGGAADSVSRRIEMRRQNRLARNAPAGSA